MSFIRAVKAPCFQALRLPRGAPLPLPPCIRQRALPLTAGDRHGAPPRVRARAPQRGADANISGCMGLNADLFVFSCAAVAVVSLESICVIGMPGIGPPFAGRCVPATTRPSMIG